MLSYVRRDLTRNPRRTLASLGGVALGLGLFSSVLFFSDGSGASMTKRSLAPLALDMQRVLPAPLGTDLRLRERVSPARALSPGERVRFDLTVVNRGSVPAGDVVVADEPQHPLTYVSGTTTLNGRRLADPGGHSPLAQGLARTGLDVRTIPPRGAVRLAYVARAERAVPRLRVQGTVSSREIVVPVRANARPPATPAQLRRRLTRIPGVAAADLLGFVDLPPGSLSAGGAVVRDPVRVFALDDAYRRHYPSIRLTAGSLRPGSAVLSAEAARALAARPGTAVELRLPGGRRALRQRIGGIADLSRAKPLFYSRKTGKLEDFLYVPNALVLDPATFNDAVVPAFRAASAARGGSVLKSFPLLELDLKVERSRLHSDPAGALVQTRAIARYSARTASDQGYLIDNISNALEVARDDARVAKRMFFFLGLPGIVLAAFLAAYAGSVVAATQRREHANLRVRGAHWGHLRRLLVYRTLAFAGLGSVVGTVIGFLAAIVVLGGGNLFEASAGSIVASALIALAAGLLTTALALYLPGRRSLKREIAAERAELSQQRPPRWRHLRLDYALLTATALGFGIALRSGAFDAAAGSVFSGRSVSLSSHLLVAPMVGWLAGTLLAGRVTQSVVGRLPVPRPPRFGPLVRGTLRRSLKRRSWELVTGVVGVGLVVAFGVTLLIFSGTYDAAKAADARYTLGSDLRITPSALSSRPHPPGFARQLLVPGVAEVTPVVAKPENSVLVGPDNQDREDLAAIDPAGFRRVAAHSDSRAVRALAADPSGLLVNSQTAEDLAVGVGDRVQVLLARGTRRQTLRPFRVVGLFDRFAGFPQGVNIVVGLPRYQAETHSRRADFFLARAADSGSAAAELRVGPGRRDALIVETARTTLDKDQSSLTALDIRGLVDLDHFFALLMVAAAIAIFVFGLMLQRRREYVTLLAQGMDTRDLGALVVAEAALVTACGLLIGLAVGTGTAFVFVHVLRPLFVLDPGISAPVADLATLAVLAVAASLAAAVAATTLIRRLRPSEVLRET